MPADEVLEQFLKAVPWNKYAGATYVFVATQRVEGLHNIRCRIVLQPSRPRGLGVASSGHGLVIRRGWLDRPATERALEGLRAGRASLGSNELLLERIGSEHGYSWWDAGTVESGRSRIEWASAMIQGTGGQIGQVLGAGRFDWIGDRLVALRPSRFMTWRDVTRMIGPPHDLTESNLAALELLAPIHARMGRPIYRPRQEQLDVLVESYLEPIGESMEIVVSSATASRVVAAIPAKSWKRVRTTIWRASVPLGQMRGRFDVTLVASGTRVWQVSAMVPSLQTRLLQSLEGGETWLRELLFPGSLSKSAADGFERGIAALLALGGLPVIPSGHVGRDRYVDLVCAVEEGFVLIGECTIGMPGPKKLADLRGRTARALTKIQLPGEVLDVVACLFTPLRMDEIAPEIVAEAHKLGVVTIARERIEVLAEAAGAGDLSGHIREMLEEWRPTHPVASLPLARKRANR